MASIFAWLNCCINPFIYFVLNPRYRNAFKRLFGVRSSYYVTSHSAISGKINNNNNTRKQTLRQQKTKPQSSSLSSSSSSPSSSSLSQQQQQQQKQILTHKQMSQKYQRQSIEEFSTTM